MYLEQASDAQSLWISMTLAGVSVSSPISLATIIPEPSPGWNEVISILYRVISESSYLISGLFQYFWRKYNKSGLIYNH